jgi:hypothetical protein
VIARAAPTAAAKASAPERHANRTGSLPTFLLYLAGGASVGVVFLGGIATRMWLRSRRSQS